MSTERVQACALTSSNGWKSKTSTGLRGGRGHEEAGRGHLFPSCSHRHGWEGRDYMVEPTVRAPACSRERAKARIERTPAPPVPRLPKYFLLVLRPQLSDCKTEKKSNLRVRSWADHHSIDEKSLWRNIASGRSLIVRQLDLAGASASRGGRRLLVPHRTWRALGD